jgi:hypothetical protein
LEHAEGDAGNEWRTSEFSEVATMEGTMSNILAIPECAFIEHASTRIREIGPQAFFNCTALNGLQLSDGVKSGWIDPNTNNISWNDSSFSIVDKHFGGIINIIVAMTGNFPPIL